MFEAEKDFLNPLNSFYPFERYIFKKPKKIDSECKDIFLTEIVISDKKKDIDEKFYVTLKCKDIEFNLSYFDFSEDIRDNIRYIFYEEFGHEEWESLYIEYEDIESYDKLKRLLRKQRKLNNEKYGKCEIRKGFTDEIVLNLLK